MRAGGFVLGFLWLLSPWRAGALTVLPATFEELVRESHTVVYGRVIAVDGQWTADRRTIETIVSLEVDEYLKGSFGSIVQFRVPGGVMGRFRNIVAGAPSFSVDQQVVVFLGTRGPNVPHVIGFKQGVYRVRPADDRIGWFVRGGRPRCR